MHATRLEHGPAPVQEIISSIILGPGLWDDWYRSWAQLAPDQFTAAYRCLMDRDDITGRVGEITGPALIVHGTSDTAIPIDKAEARRADLGGEATLVVIEGPRTRRT